MNIVDGCAIIYLTHFSSEDSQLFYYFTKWTSAAADTRRKKMKISLIFLRVFCGFLVFAERRIRLLA